MQLTTFNPNQVFASILERDTSVSKNEFIKQLRARINTAEPKFRKLSQVVSQLPFFQVSKNGAGQIIFN